MALPTIPDFITVHLGEPSDTSAPNVRVPFIDYIKNTASSEIYPTWPDSALRANIYAQISFALNRVFTEYYRSRGYDFDITNSTRFDQSFVNGRDIYDNISLIVDDIFNDYIVRQGNVEPLFAQYCDGIEVTCSGLSQWGTVSLAREGLTPYEILQNYYGDDINIVFNAPTSRALPSYPGVPLRLGTVSEDVRTIQRQLNRIGVNYPAVRPRLTADGVFNTSTEEAVKSFQSIFNLTPDGIVGKATWYRIKSIFNAVKGLADLQSEGLTIEDIDRIFASNLGPGDTGPQVRVVQYYLAVIGYFDDEIPQVRLTGTFDSATESAVRAFQEQQGLPVDGVVGRETWNALTESYLRIITSLPPEFSNVAAEIYPGRVLSLGIEGEDVRRLQTFINLASENYSYIPRVTVDGIYGQGTASAVRIIQENNGIPVSGLTGPTTWYAIIRLAQVE
ncbi:MAG: spore cortex-lytic protein [Ruminococcaceae bacterium]|nr:spore cortex-lytic protein [Oscillospiraceae bacterium]